MGNDTDFDSPPEAGKLHTPEEIAELCGGLSLKSLNELIRNEGFETTSLGYAQASRRGGPRRRLWAMNDAQLKALLARRERRRSSSTGPA